MKTYLFVIKRIQTTLLALGIFTLMILPLALIFFPETTLAQTAVLYAVAHVTVFLVMLVRPLADIFPWIPFLRPLVILRKGLGVLSASIIVSFLLAKLLIDPIGYVVSLTQTAYWSLAGYTLLAHLADITAVILLVTSNNLSKRLLGAWWKRVQRLSYVYFYASAFYVFAKFGDVTVFFYMFVITIVTLTAFVGNRFLRVQPVTQTI